MGLAIHYQIRLKPDQTDAIDAVRRMRQLALALPFESVGPIHDLSDEACNFEARREELQNGNEAEGELFWMLIQAHQNPQYPWNKHISQSIMPTRMIGFSAWPGPGSETANIGLCLYPNEVQLKYNPREDQKYWTGYKLDWKKYVRKCPLGTRSETRSVPTNLTPWSWSSFCKTQYASNPDCGGVANFLKCHITVIALLDRIATLPGVKVRIEDEGSYGPHSLQKGRHKGHYNPAKLANEVGSWNEMVASLTGSLSDTFDGDGVVSPIKDYANFEQLEFRGRKNQAHLEEFLATIKNMTLPKGEESHG